MDFTREPIIETVVTPKEGCKLVVRSSKAGGQEEYFVDAVEVVSFGNSVFFRSQERPKAFIVPAADYEILEVREARMVLKNVGLDRSIKIGGGRDNNAKPAKEPQAEKTAPQQEETLPTAQAVTDAIEAKTDGRKKDRRRQYRRRRGQGEGLAEGESENKEETVGDVPSNLPAAETSKQPVVGVILPPPPILISETIARYKDDERFKGAFYTKEEMTFKATNEGGQEDVLQVLAPSENLGVIEPPFIPLAQPEYGSFEASEDEEEAIYKERTHQPFLKEEDDILPTTRFGEEEFPDKDYSHPRHDDNS